MFYGTACLGTAGGSRDGHPGKPERLTGRVYQQLEETVFQGYCSGCHWNSAAYKLLDLARDLAEKLPG